jgi:hypothetical protein
MARYNGVRSKGGIIVEIEGMDELLEQIERVGEFKKTHITRSARKGMDKILPEAKAKAPKKSGALKKGIKRKLETPRKRSKYKSVYKMHFDPKMDDVFRKPIEKKNEGIYGGKKNPAYYPHSMEYGFPHKGGFKEGLYFIKKTIEKNEKNTLETVVSELTQELKKLT